VRLREKPDAEAFIQEYKEVIVTFAEASRIAYADACQNTKMIRGKRGIRDKAAREPNKINTDQFPQCGENPLRTQ